GLTKKDSAAALNAFVDGVIETMKKGDKVTLIGFGTFASVHREATTKRNPRTGEPIDVPARNVPKFRPGKGLKDALG
ncbi:MAG: HU family DNA-binding protein, partial [Chloroflexota bacterium]